MDAPYVFGRFELNPATRQLRADGNPVSLGARGFDVLVALVERRERLVTKDELLQLAWPGLVVEENNLQVQISVLRKVLGPQAISTVPGRGYRFALEVSAANDSASVSGAPRHNLPPQLTSFVGHEDDLNEYAKLLGQTRLLTLTGIGGCGKTRLALELAQRMLPSFADGVWYVDLAPLLDAERVALTVATARGVREEQDREIVDTLCHRLSAQRSLLVLDNCEHLVAACAALAQRLLAAAPGVHVLAASREGLGVPGERVVTVRSLGFPSAGSRPDLPALERCEAVRLFVERAQLAVPEFSLGADTAEVVGEICRRLDGIPLAIELAAARVKILSVQEIRARLDDRFRLLSGGNKAALGRQQTLLAAIQWSYDHLAPTEQRALRRLAVFVGGWTLEAAVRVIGDALDEYAVLDLHARLVDQSLVIPRRGESGVTRYSMLETVRDYAQERLIQAGEDASARDCHLDFYVTLAESAEPELIGSEQRAWFAKLDSELENFLAAHAWCDHAADRAEPGLRLASSLRRYLKDRAIALGHRMVVEALARPGAQARSLARCRALSAAGALSYFLARYREAKEHSAAGLEIARELREDRLTRETLRYLGYAEAALGNVAGARAHCEQALAMSRAAGVTVEISSLLTSLGEMRRAVGQFQEAQALYREALALSREQRDLGGISVNLVNLTMTSISLGRGDQARESMRAAFAILDEMGSKREGVCQVTCLTAVAAFLGDWHCAGRFHGATQALMQQMGWQTEPVDAAFFAPLIAHARDSLGAAAFSAAESSGRGLSYEEMVAEARAWLEQEGTR